MSASHRTRWIIPLALFFTVALSMPLLPQTTGFVTRVAWNFDIEPVDNGFTFTATQPPVIWRADDSPGAVINQPSYVTFPKSLNYNNDLNFDSGTAANSGTATSPAVSVAGLTTPQLVFYCNYSTETTGTGFDTRTVQVSGDGFATTPVNMQLSGETMGVWHTHTISLAGFAGNIQVRFLFNSGDALFNDFAGWFIDQVEIQSIGTIGGGPSSGSGSSGGCTAGGGDGTLLPLAIVILALVAVRIFRP